MLEADASQWFEPSVVLNAQCATVQGITTCVFSNPYRIGNAIIPKYFL